VSQESDHGSQQDSAQDPECCKGVPCDYPYLPTLEVGPKYAAKVLSGKGHAAPMLIDCRRDEEVAAVCLCNHVHIPLDELAARTREIDQALAARNEPKGTEILIICHSGRRSLFAANTLKAAGYEGARSIVGGIDLWALTIDPSVPRYTKTAGCITVIPPQK